MKTQKTKTYVNILPDEEQKGRGERKDPKGAEIILQEEEKETRQQARPFVVMRDKKFEFWCLDTYSLYLGWSSPHGVGIPVQGLGYYGTEKKVEPSSTQLLLFAHRQPRVGGPFIPFQQEWSSWAAVRRMFSEFPRDNCSSVVESASCPQNLRKKSRKKSRILLRVSCSDVRIMFGGSEEVVVRLYVVLTG